MKTVFFLYCNLLHYFSAHKSLHPMIFLFFFNVEAFSCFDSRVEITRSISKFVDSAADVGNSRASQDVRGADKVVHQLTQILLKILLFETYGLHSILVVWLFCRRSFFANWNLGCFFSNSCFFFVFFWRLEDVRLSKRSGCIKFLPNLINVCLRLHP